jgi:hypothetical protein
MVSDPAYPPASCTLQKHASSASLVATGSGQGCARVASEQPAWVVARVRNILSVVRLELMQVSYPLGIQAKGRSKSAQQSRHMDRT